MTYIYSGAVPSEITSVCRVVTRIVDALRSRLHPSELFDLRLILSELMINGCEHGNGNDRTKAVFLELTVTEEAIDIVVTDEGRGFCYDEASYDPCNLTCSGRGLKIVSALCDAMEIEKSRVRCQVRLPAVTPSERR